METTGTIYEQKMQAIQGCVAEAYWENVWQLTEAAIEALRRFAQPFYEVIYEVIGQMVFPFANAPAERIRRSRRFCRVR